MNKKRTLKERPILGVLTVCLSLLLLAGCTSNQSAKFKEAGCVEADSNGMEEAAAQFYLAAENGDPEAVVAAIAAQRIWGIFMTIGTMEYSALESTKEYVRDLSSDIASYCGDGYDIR